MKKKSKTEQQNSEEEKNNSSKIEAYNAFMNELNANISQNSNNLDNYIIKLAPIFLAGSLTIITTRENLYLSDFTLILLITSWVFMIASIISVLYSIHYSNSSHSQAADLAYRIYIKEDPLASSEFSRISTKLDRFNKANTFFFAFGIILFTLFVSITIIKGNSMKNSGKHITPKVKDMQNNTLFGEGQKLPELRQPVKDPKTSESQKHINNREAKKDEK